MILGEILICNEDIHLAALHILFQKIPNRCLEIIQFLWHLQIHVQISVIYGLDLYCDLLFFISQFETAEPRHTLDHAGLLPAAAKYRTYRFIIVY